MRPVYQALNIGANRCRAKALASDGRDSYWCTLGGSTSGSNKNCDRIPCVQQPVHVADDNTDKGASTQ